MSQSLSGLFAAVLTPTLDDGSIDIPLLTSHCKNLLVKGCHGISLFGTTGEGPSFTGSERMEALEAMLDAGISPDKILPGTGSASNQEAIALTRHSLEHGCNNILLMPPFFFKNLNDDNVVASYKQLIDAVATPSLRVYIYNFPAITGVTVSVDAIGQLVDAYPETIAGVKDSSGDWDYVNAIRDRFAHLALFTGWEILVPKLRAIGGVGNISGLANVIPEQLRDLIDRAPEAEDDAVLRGVAALVDAATSVPTTPAIKSLLAHVHATDHWRNVRPPLLPLTEQQNSELIRSYDKALAIAAGRS